MISGAAATSSLLTSRPSGPVCFVTSVCPSYVDTGMFAGVKPPKLTRFLTPDKVADHVLSAVRHNRAFVLEPWLIKVTPFLVNTLPQPVADLVSDAFGATTGMKSWHGRER